MGSGSRPGRLTALSIAAVGTLSLACESSSSPATSGTTLARNAIVPLSGVSRFFPDIIRETSTGRNLTATGNPKATRMVIYETGDGSKKVTITVDQYGSSSDASSAYQQAVQKSQSVPGFKPVPVPTLGQQTFAGTVTMGAETHSACKVPPPRGPWVPVVAASTLAASAIVTAPNACYLYRAQPFTLTGRRSA